MKKKNEDVAKLLDEINRVLGDTSKSAEIFYLLKKQGLTSTKQKEEIIKLERQIVESQRKSTEYASKFIQLLHILKQQGEISGRQQTGLIELGKKVIENHKATKEILLSLAGIAKTLKVILPKSFDVVVKNTNDFPGEFKISNLDEIPKPPNEVFVKEPLWLPNFFEAAFKFLTQPIIRTVQKQLQNVNITGPTDPRKAIAVRLSDGNRFYTAILQAISAAGSNSQKVEDLLQQIADNTDTLELKTDQVNLNTDSLEMLLAQFEFISGRLKVDADIIIPSDPNSDVPRSTRASESTLVQVRDYLDTVESKLQTVIDGNLWQREVIAGNGFVTTTNNITIANINETPFLLIKNPSNSGKTARIHRIWVGADQNQANKAAFFRIYRDPAITADGTVVPINNLKKGAGVSALSAFKLPNLSVNGTLLGVGNCGAVIDVSDHADLGGLIIPNENFLMTVKATSGGFDFFVTIYWVEV